jgi:N4-gp56 family major capsid protein
MADTLGPNASEHVSPVDKTTGATGHITHVGPRTNGLPTGSDAVQSLVTRAYNLAALQTLRRQLVWDRFATVRASNLSHNGAVVQFNFVDDLDDDPTKATLDEDYDVLPTPLKSWPTDVTMREYGRAVTTTALLRGTSMVPVDPIAAERVGRNAGSVIDRLAFAPLIAAGGITNSGAAGGAPVDVSVASSPSDTLRAASQKFKEDDVAPFANGMFTAIMTPACETALRKEADAAGWRYWQINQEEMGGTGDIARGAVGAYEGFNIIVANTPGLEAVGAVFLGNEALAKAYSVAPGFGANPQVVVSPVVDRLKRFASVGWYHLVGYSRFRAEAVLVGDLTATP